jgi:hypothetical protein
VVASPGRGNRECETNQGVNKDGAALFNRLGCTAPKEAKQAQPNNMRTRARQKSDFMFADEAIDSFG